MAWSNLKYIQNVLLSLFQSLHSNNYIIWNDLEIIANDVLWFIIALEKNNTKKLKVIEKKYLIYHLNIFKFDEILLFKEL